MLHIYFLQLSSLSHNFLFRLSIFFSMIIKHPQSSPLNYSRYNIFGHHVSLCFMCVGWHFKGRICFLLQPLRGIVTICYSNFPPFHRLWCQLLQSIMPERGQQLLLSLCLPLGLLSHGEPVRALHYLHTHWPRRGRGWQHHTHTGPGSLHSGELHPLPPAHVWDSLAWRHALQLQQDVSVTFLLNI